MGGNITLQKVILGNRRSLGDTEMMSRYFKDIARKILDMWRE